MKRIITGIFVILLALSFAACCRPDSPVPADEPTAAPTEAPAAEPTEVPEPQTGVLDFLTKVEPDTQVSIDIDYDGMEDRIAFREDEGGKAEVEISRGADIAHVFTYEVPYSYGVTMWIMDCDPTDSRLEVVITYVQDSDDSSSVAFRVNEEGTWLDTFESGMAVTIPDGYLFEHEAGFPVSIRTEILGTCFVEGSCTVTADGFKLVSEGCLYPVTEGYSRELELKRDMELEIVDETGSATGESVTVPAGESITPYSTDLESWVCVKLGDGRIGRAAVAEATGESRGWLINGIQQDEYADIPYAD